MIVVKILCRLETSQQFEVCYKIVIIEIKYMYLLPVRNRSMAPNLKTITYARMSILHINNQGRRL